MPPKKSSKATKAEPEKPKDRNGDAPPTTHGAADPVDEDEPSKDTKPGSKRKKDSKAQSEPNKEPRRSGRGAAKSQPSPSQLLQFLLSPEAINLCRPDDEVKDLESRGKDTRTYSSSVLNPFEELLCAIILSRPISHMLGLRTIRTVLNDPYNFSSPEAVQKAGQEKWHQAVWDAHTQHKAKTAEQIGLVADVVAEKFSPGGPSDSSLEGVRKQGDHDYDKERALLQDNIKGVGKTGLDIFFRRVQWLWAKSFPFVDERTAKGLEKLGLPSEADNLVKLIGEDWEKLKKLDIAGKDEEERKRRAFVVVLERVIGADLEKKGDTVAEEAAKL